MPDPAALSAVAATSFGLVFLAEMGDKSQLVCMTLAARHRHWPVLSGASAAFVVLNALAVTVGAGLAHWIPERALAVVVAALFAVFGIASLRSGDDDEDEIREKGGHGVLLTTFLMILLAETGDKTQIAVAGLASTLPAFPVWAGSTAALLVTSALGVLAGTRLLRRIPLRRLRQSSGVFFLVLAALALGRAV
jgi:putative Ca2+/H+ antiporter (TMEM165/GDT1 family)